MIEAVQGVRWAPIKVPVRRRLQTMAVLFGIILFPLCFVVTALLLFWKPLTDLYTREITLIYILWIVLFDSKTPLSGGRMLLWFRQLRTWKYIIDYFPARVFLPHGGYDKSKTYVFALHPHGIISMAAICNLAYDSVRPIQFGGGAGVTSSISFAEGVNNDGSEPSQDSDNPTNSKVPGEVSGGEDSAEVDNTTNTNGDKIDKSKDRAASNASDTQDPVNHTSTSDASHVSSSSTPDVSSGLSKKPSKAHLLPSVLQPPETCVLEAKLRASNGPVVLKSSPSAANIKEKFAPVVKHMHPSEAIGIPYRFLTVTFNFLVPVWREILLGMGFISASRESAIACLKKGLSVAVVVGGALESLDAKPGTADLTLARRKGFVRLALEQGADLVPVYNFGESELFEQVPNPKGSLLRSIQEKFIRWIGWTVPAFYGRGVFNYDCGVLPRRVPLVTVFGSPVPVEKVENPTREQVDVLHAKYTDALRELYDRYKDGYYEHLADLGFRDQDGKPLNPVSLNIVG